MYQTGITEEADDGADQEESFAKPSDPRRCMDFMWKVVAKSNAGLIKILKMIIFGKFMAVLVKLPWKIIAALPILKLLKEPIEQMFQNFRGEGGDESKDDGDDSKAPLIEEITIPSVMEMAKAGILFSPINGGISDISFDNKTSTLSLPVINLDVNTEVYLRNLVAYEACVAAGPLVVARYTELMNGIIDTEEDAKYLRERGIVLNYLKSDKEVADLWNGMSKSVKLTKVPKMDKVIEDVNKRAVFESVQVGQPFRALKVLKVCIVPLAFNLLNFPLPGMSSGSQSVGDPVVPKFDMHIYTSVSTTGEVNSLVREYAIPLDLHPSSPPPTLTMNNLSADKIVATNMSQFLKFPMFRGVRNYKGTKVVEHENESVLAAQRKAKAAEDKATSKRSATEATSSRTKKKKTAPKYFALSESELEESTRTDSVCIVPLAFNLLNFPLPGMSSGSQSVGDPVVPKFDMHIYTSVLTTSEVNSLVREYTIPLDLRPSVPPPTLTMNNLSADKIGYPSTVLKHNRPSSGSSGYVIRYWSYTNMEACGGIIRFLKMVMGMKSDHQKVVEHENESVLAAQRKAQATEDKAAIKRSAAEATSPRTNKKKTAPMYFALSESELEESTRTDSVTLHSASPLNTIILNDAKPTAVGNTLVLESVSRPEGNTEHDLDDAWNYDEVNSSHSTSFLHSEQSHLSQHYAHSEEDTHTRSSGGGAFHDGGGVHVRGHASSSTG
nr:putative UPF0481 protein At3g02645 [Tanacetum cinerariifolium]